MNIFIPITLTAALVALSLSPKNSFCEETTTEMEEYVEWLNRQEKERERAFKAKEIPAPGTALKQMKEFNKAVRSGRSPASGERMQKPPAKMTLDELREEAQKAGERRLPGKPPDNSRRSPWSGQPMDARPRTGLQMQEPPPIPDILSDKTIPMPDISPDKKTWKDGKAPPPVSGKKLPPGKAEERGFPSGEIEIGTPHGSVPLAIEPGVAAAIKAIHARRDALYARGGKTIDEVDADLRVKGPDVGVKLRIDTKTGVISGLYKKTGNDKQPYQIWTAELNSEGNMARGVVRVEEAQKPTLAVESYDHAGKISSRLSITPFNIRFWNEVSYEYRPGAKEAIEAIHRERAEFYSTRKEKTLEGAQERFSKEGEYVSVFLKIDEKESHVIGMFKPRVEPHDHPQIWTAGLNPDGKTRRVVLSQLKQPVGVLIESFDAGSRSAGRWFISAFDSRREK